MEHQIELMLCGGQYKQLLEHKFAEIREKYGLRKIDIEVLYYLSQCGSKNTAKDINLETKFTKGHISQSIDRLQKMELLMVMPDEHDRRCVHCALNEKAHALGAEILQIKKNIYDMILDGITPEEKEVLLRAVEKMEKNMEHAMHI